MNKEEITLIKCNENGSIEYIGYIKMLDKIVDLIDEFSYSNKLVLLDKYIEILKIVKGGKEWR